MDRNKKIVSLVVAIVVLLLVVYSCGRKKKLRNELLNSAYRGDYEKVKELIEEDGVDINFTKEGEGETALKKAALKGHTRVVEYLIKHGADIEAADPSGVTPFMDTAFGHYDTMKVLIAAGAYVDAKDKDGVTALIRATYKNDVEIVELLIRSHTDVNHKDSSGASALMLAQQRGYKEIAKMLKAAGAVETE